MKKTILLSGVLAVMLNFANGQVQRRVSNDAFVTAIGTLNNAISSKNIPGANNAIAQLNGMMNTQIAYMKSNISVLQTKHVADSTAAGTAWIAAEQELVTSKIEMTNALKAQDSSSITAAEVAAINQAKADNLKAGQDIASATALQKAALAEGNVIKQQAALLTTENMSYGDAQYLEKNMIPNKVAITADLKAFAATLQ